MLWYSQMHCPDNLALNLNVMGLHAGMAFACDPAPSTTFLTQNLCSGFLYICHSMCPGSPLYWVECLKSRPGHLYWVHADIGPESFLRTGCPSHWAGGNVHWWRPASATTPLFTTKGACLLQPLSLEWSGPLLQPSSAAGGCTGLHTPPG